MRARLVRRAASQAARGSRFAFVGLLGIGVNQFLLWILVEAAGLHYVLAAALASQGSTAFNFVLVEVWVFRGGGRRSILKRFIGFDLMNSASLLLRLPMLYLLTSGLHLHYLLSNLVAIGALTVVRFVVADNLIWARAVPPPAPEPHGLSRDSAPAGSVSGVTTHSGHPDPALSLDRRLQEAVPDRIPVEAPLLRAQVERQ